MTLTVDMVQALRRIDTGVTAAVARRLGVAVVLLRWDVDRRGASVPVFAVPAEVVQEARALGLRVEVR